MLVRSIEYGMANLGTPDCHPGELPSKEDLIAVGLVRTAEDALPEDISALSVRILGTLSYELKPGSQGEMKRYLDKKTDEFDLEEATEGKDFNPSGNLPSSSAVTQLFGHLEEYAEGIAASSEALANIHKAKLLISFAVGKAIEEINGQVA